MRCMKELRHGIMKRIVLLSVTMLILVLLNFPVSAKAASFANITKPPKTIHLYLHDENQNPKQTLAFEYQLINQNGKKMTAGSVKSSKKAVATAKLAPYASKDAIWILAKSVGTTTVTYNVKQGGTTQKYSVTVKVHKHNPFKTLKIGSTSILKAGNAPYLEDEGYYFIYTGKKKLENTFKIVLNSDWQIVSMEQVYEKFNANDGASIWKRTKVKNGKTIRIERTNKYAYYVLITLENTKTHKQLGYWIEAGQRNTIS